MSKIVIFQVSLMINSSLILRDSKLDKLVPCHIKKTCQRYFINKSAVKCPTRASNAWQVMEIDDLYQVHHPHSKTSLTVNDFYRLKEAYHTKSE